MRLKNVQVIVLFFFGLVVLGITIFNWRTIRGFVNAESVNTTQQSNFIIYDDQLHPDFKNWSWNSAINFNATHIQYAGKASLSYQPSAWGALYLHTDTAIELNQYSALHFYLLPSKKNQQLSLVVYDSNNKPIRTALPLAKYTNNQTITVWNEYTIPISEILPHTASIKGIAIQETSGVAQSPIYVDNLELVRKTETASYNIYEEGLREGWVNWSWDSTVNFDSYYPTYQGSKSISYTSHNGWAGLYLHSDKGVVSTQYAAVRFAMKATQDGQRFAIILYGENNQPLQNPIPLDAYSGQPVATTWKEYTIPLQAFNAANATIKGIGFFDLTGRSQPAVFIDNIAFIMQTNASVTIAPTIVPVTPTMFVTPTIVAPTAPVTPTTPILPTTPVSQSVSMTIGGNPLSGMTLFNDPDTNSAVNQIQQWQSSRPTDATMLNKIASQPKAIWLGGWNGNIQLDTHSKVEKAAQSNALPVFVAYNIPHRDCGSYSAGGSSSSQVYRDWINSLATGIGNKKALVVLEPDALAQITCLSSEGQQNRYELMKYAVQKLKSLGNTAVYIDAGHADWIPASDMAQRLRQSGIDMADGFSLNISNFISNDITINYGKELSSHINGKHFIIDTSRNGNGAAPDKAWCNPSDRALGDRPTTNTGHALVDGFFWLKYPGQSDGNCNGGPNAGEWFPDYALGLAQRARW